MRPPATIREEAMLCILLMRSLGIIGFAALDGRAWRVGRDGAARAETCPNAFMAAGLGI
jgi:hypothetical protein